MKDHRIELWLKHYGEEVEVYFSLYPGACKNCIQEYLTNGIGSEPVLYKLKDIIKNECNAGCGLADVYLTSGVLNLCCPHHLTVKPANSRWEPSKSEYVLVRNTKGVNRKSKITVTIKKTK